MNRQNIHFTVIAAALILLFLTAGVFLATSLGVPPENSAGQNPDQRADQSAAATRGESFDGSDILPSEPEKQVLQLDKDLADRLAPHKALYRVNLVAAKSGAQLIDVGGEMYYELAAGCDGWTADYRFNLRYDYADTPPAEIKSNFSTYETYDGQSFSFASDRRRGDILFEQLSGQATLRGGAHKKAAKEREGRRDIEKNEKKHRQESVRSDFRNKNNSFSATAGGEAVYNEPEGIRFDLPAGTLFPVRHTYELLKAIDEGRLFFYATVFDGSDAEGLLEINAFISPGDQTAPPPAKNAGDGLDSSLLEGEPRRVRMAFFKQQERSEDSDYEMEMSLYKNGIVGDMVIEYDTFTVRQDLVALESLPQPDCSGTDVKETDKPNAE